MLDIYLKGSCVRDLYGVKGRILSIADKAVRIGWEDSQSPILRESSYKLEELQAVEILTLDRGWASLKDVLRTARSSVTEGVRKITDELSVLLETKKPKPDEQNPFLHKKRLGPGPRGGTLASKKRWKCHGSNYEYTCLGIDETTKGRKIKIKIDKAYKAAYNADYKKWRAAKGR